MKNKLLIIGVISLIVLSVMGISNFSLWGWSVFTKDVKIALNENPVIQRHIGEVDDMNFEIIASNMQLDRNVFVFKIKGTKQSGVVKAKYISTIYGEEVRSGTLELSSGEIYDLLELVFDESILDKTYDYVWSFERAYQNKNGFIKEFVAYNQEILETPEVIDFQITAASELIILYEGKLANQNNYTEQEINIKGDEEYGISFFGLLYQLNNGAHDYLANIDHHFYEGLSFMGYEEGKPVLRLELGS